LPSRPPRHVGCQNSGRSLYVVDPRSGTLDLGAHVGLDEDFVRQVAHYDADSPQALTVMSGDIFEMPFQDMPFQGRPSTPDGALLGAGLAAALVLPIRHEGRVIADLNLVSKLQMRLSDESRSALLTLAAYCASAIDRVRAQMALADNRRNLESLFSTLDDLLFVVDLEGRIVHVNPAVERRMGTPAPAGTPAEPLAAQHGTETVAVVEDDELMRGFACRVLGMHGYKAMPFETPEACLGTLAGGALPLDLLLTDIRLPGMDGRELGRRLVALRPGLPVLYMTGFAEEPHGKADSRHSEAPSLTKPFTPSELLDHVRAAFDA